jgi:hypothetical protein
MMLQWWRHRRAHADGRWLPQGWGCRWCDRERRAYLLSERHQQVHRRVDEVFGRPSADGGLSILDSPLAVFGPQLRVELVHRAGGEIEVTVLDCNGSHVAKGRARTDWLAPVVNQPNYLASIMCDVLL